MSDEYLIRHCAPTLAGIKTASLFTCPFESRKALCDGIRRLNRCLRAKGLRILPLRFTENRALIYLYRPGKLTEDLHQERAWGLLRQCGYNAGSCEACVGQLARKIRQQPDFPHEIGLFLGYPAEDVCGFIEHGPDCCKCSGCWKVYTDVEKAQKTFAQYKKCSRIYRELWAKGNDIERLTVAG